MDKRLKKKEEKKRKKIRGQKGTRKWVVEVNIITFGVFPFKNETLFCTEYDCYTREYNSYSVDNTIPAL